MALSLCKGFAFTTKLQNQWQLVNQLILNIYFYSVKQVITSENQQVQWTTPLGLQVVQPYMKTERHLVSFLDCN